MTSATKLMHTVVFWLKTGTPAEIPQEMADFYYQRIQQVSGVESVFCGHPAGTDREVVDASYQVLSSVVFTGPEAQDAWQVDPVHDEFRGRFGDHFDRVIVYDNLDLAR